MNTIVGASIVSHLHLRTCLLVIHVSLLSPSFGEPTGLLFIPLNKTEWLLSGLGK